jgi:hypothetical protein
MPLVHALRHLLHAYAAPAAGNRVRLPYANYAAADLTLRELVFALLPLSASWRDVVVRANRIDLLPDDERRDVLDRVHLDRAAPRG